MRQVHDFWERLVAAVIRKQQLWKLFHDQSRSPSICSEASESSSSFNFEELELNPSFDAKKEDDGESSPFAKEFNFRELAAATKNFRADCLLRVVGFGGLYKGRLEGTEQIVAIKQLDSNGLQGNREFLTEVLMLSLLHHPNVVNLIGYCVSGKQRLLVYEYMPLGSLEDHLHDLPPDKEPLDWNARMKIAFGAAKCLEYMHEKSNPPVIHRNLKCSNILLGEGYNPKLFDFVLAKLGPNGDKTYVSTRVIGTAGYCAPEYAMMGQLTVKADVYSFGVVLLEIITGRKAIDNSRAAGEHNLVAWVFVGYLVARSLADVCVCKSMKKPHKEGSWRGKCQQQVNSKIQAVLAIASVEISWYCDSQFFPGSRNAFHPSRLSPTVFVIFFCIVIDHLGCTLVPEYVVCPNLKIYLHELCH